MTPSREHPLLAPREDGGSCEVRFWNTAAPGEDPCVPAREYAEQRHGAAGQLRSRARTLTQSPNRRHHAEQSGHWLRGEFNDLYELKTKKDRFLAFLEGDTFYIVLGCSKKKAKAQAKDYRQALAIAHNAQQQLREER